MTSSFQNVSIAVVNSIVPFWEERLCTGDLNHLWPMWEHTTFCLISKSMFTENARNSYGTMANIHYFMWCWHCENNELVRFIYVPQWTRNVIDDIFPLYVIILAPDRSEYWNQTETFIGALQSYPCQFYRSHFIFSIGKNQQLYHNRTMNAVKWCYRERVSISCVKPNIVS